MVAILTGPGFKIDAITKVKQSIAERHPTVWSWYVEANSAGDQELEATLYALDYLVDSYTISVSVA